MAESEVISMFNGYRVGTKNYPNANDLKNKHISKKIIEGHALSASIFSRSRPY